MIELLKYLANNLKSEQLLEVADILARNPQVIDPDSFIQMVNEIEGFEMRKIDKSQYNELEKRFKEIDDIRIKSQLYNLLKDNNIGLN